MIRCCCPQLCRGLSNELCDTSENHEDSPSSNAKMGMNSGLGTARTMTKVPCGLRRGTYSAIGRSSGSAAVSEACVLVQARLTDCTDDEIERSLVTLDAFRNAVAITPVAPRARASPALLEPHEIAVTRAPIGVARLHLHRREVPRLQDRYPSVRGLRRSSPILCKVAA